MIDITNADARVYFGRVKELKEDIKAVRTSIENQVAILDWLDSIELRLTNATYEYKKVILAIDNFSDRCSGISSVGVELGSRWATLIVGKGNYCLMAEGQHRKTKKFWPKTMEEALEMAGKWIVEDIR